jgi:hypothetical protein
MAAVTMAGFYLCGTLAQSLKSTIKIGVLAMLGVTNVPARSTSAIQYLQNNNGLGGLN